MNLCFQAGVRDLNVRGRINMNRLVSIILIAICLMGCGRGTSDYELGSADFGADTLLIVEKEMGFKLPTGAKGLNFYYKAPIDPAFIAKIEIPSVAKDGMVKQLLAIPNKPLNSSGGLSKRILWWTPTYGRIVQDRMFFDASNGQSRRVVLTEKDGKWFLYLDWST